jgi:hypothetical protein
MFGQSAKPPFGLTSASNQLSLVVSIAAIASPTQRRAASSWPSSAWAAAKYDNHDGRECVAPVDRIASPIFVFHMRNLMDRPGLAKIYQQSQSLRRA